VEDLARPRLAALPLVLMLALAAAPAARAADPRVDSLVRPDGTTVIRYVAPSGQDNEVQMRIRAEELDPYKRQAGIIEDTGVDFYDIGADGITPVGPLCNPQGTGVGCDVVGSKVEVQVTLADGDDFIQPMYDRARRVRAVIKGGAGADIMSVFGSVPTAVDFSGGAGADAIDYFSRRNEPYSFTDDSLFNDGLGFDRVRNDVELWVGGDGNDRFAFTGRGRHVVFGAGGDDTMVSGPGPDEFDGGYGGDPAGVDAVSNDTVTYAGRPTGVTVTVDGLPDDGALGEGDEVLPTVERVVGTDHGDTLVGPANAPSDRSYGLEGGDGNDILSGGAGQDLIDASRGDDVVISLGGGKDAVKCGTGNDVLLSDRTDLTRKVPDCEQVLHAYLTGASNQTGTAVTSALAVPAPGSTITATLESASGAAFGSGKFASGAGLRQLTVPLNTTGKQALQQAHTLTVTLKVKIASAGRATISASKKVALSEGSGGAASHRARIASLK
jgi:hemolysin type calcium-binding protein